MELRNLTQLEELGLDYNHFNGTISSSLCSSLFHLNHFGANFSKSLPNVTCECCSQDCSSQTNKHFTKMNGNQLAKKGSGGLWMTVRTLPWGKCEHFEGKESILVSFNSVIFVLCRRKILYEYTFYRRDIFDVYQLLAFPCLLFLD